MNTWKHRDTELDRTCRPRSGPVPVRREDRFGRVSDPFCEACDGEVYDSALAEAYPLTRCRECSEVITDNGDGFWIHNGSKSNNCDPNDPEGSTATPAEAEGGTA